MTGVQTCALPILAPPLLAKRNAKGELQKQKFGPAMLMGFKLLKHLKVLRGTPLDVFGYTDERRSERAWIADYCAMLDEVLPKLSSDTHAQALAWARVPASIKGFGHVKARNQAVARSQWDQAQAQWRA